LIHIVHDYDYAGNRLYRNDLVQSANSELYSYDSLGQIKTLNRGELNSVQNAVTTVNHSESWNFDKTGNWLQYTKNGNVENRTHNAANELQGIATHDANGNMTLLPGLKGKYDAWNRLVEVRDSSDNLIANYEYNGLNQRIKKTVGSTVTKSFFNENWQEIESQTGAETTNYIWGLRYIDDLLLLEKGMEKLYSLADSNWNVVATIDSTGSVVERMKYDAFGKITWLDNNFSVKNDSDYNWNRTFTGQVLDVETGLMLYRNRYYHVGFGRFISKDPIEYLGDGVNLYIYAFCNPIIYTDALGYASLFEIAKNNFMKGKTFGNVSGDNNEFCVSGNSKLFSIPIPSFPGLFIDVDIIYSYCRKKCCPKAKCCYESDYDRFNELSLGIELYGKYGKSFKRNTGKRNEKIPDPHDPLKIPKKRKKINGGDDPDYGDTRGSGGAGGSGSYNSRCPKPGCGAITGLVFIRGCAGAGFGGCFEGTFGGSTDLGLVGKISGGWQFGVIGAYVELGGSLSGTCIF
jgi:RHS repeat-associated protein